MSKRPRLDKKVQELTIQLRELAIQKGPEARLPTTRELCVLLKTNSATLNEALEELEQQHIIYRKHKSGIFVSPKLHRKAICVLFFSRLFTAEALSPFWSMLWAQFSEEMKKRHAVGNEYYSFHMVPESLNEPGELAPENLPEPVLELIQRGRVHGVLTVGMEYRVYEWLVRQNIPSVSFAGVGSLMVGIYNEETVSTVIDDLVARGCRAIGVWIPSISSAGGYYDTPAYRGWRARLGDLQMPVYEELFRWGEPLSVERINHMYDYQKQGYQLAHAVFGSRDNFRPDGLFITNDLMTRGVLAALDELGIEVGKDVYITSLANAGSPVLVNGKASSLTLMEIDVGELVQKMFSLMEKALEEQSVSALQMYYLHPGLHRVEA